MVEGGIRGRGREGEEGEKEDKYKFSIMPLLIQDC